jgi:ABC-2 type transport system ATP-binding protein
MINLDVSHLQKRYGEVLAVDDLSFQVADGEIFGLIGPNGAGKSTAIMMITGLLKPDAGTIALHGRPYDPQDPGMRSGFGVVPQELAIYPDLTAIQNLRLFGKLNGLRGPRLQERVDSVLEATGLARNADQLPKTFSGGMSRRLNFGIALLHEPSFIVLDEPTVGIDPQSRSCLLAAIQQLAMEGVGILYASHYMEEVEAICHRVAIIDHGRLLRQGTLDELLKRTGSEICLTTQALPDEVVAELERVADVSRDSNGSSRIVIRECLGCQALAGELKDVLEILEREHVALQQLRSQVTNLETLFLSLTGRTLRD